MLALRSVVWIDPLTQRAAASPCVSRYPTPARTVRCRCDMIRHVSRRASRAVLPVLRNATPLKTRATAIWGRGPKLLKNKRPPGVRGLTRALDLR